MPTAEGHRPAWDELPLFRYRAIPSRSEVIARQLRQKVSSGIGMLRLLYPEPTRTFISAHKPLTSDCSLVACATGFERSLFLRWFGEGRSLGGEGGLGDER